VWVAYNGIHNRVNHIVLQSDLNTFAKKVYEYQAVNGVFTQANTTDLAKLDYKISKNAYTVSAYNFYYCKPTNAQKLSITAESNSGKRYTMGTNASSVKEYTGAWYSSGICPTTSMSDSTHLPRFNIANGFWASWVE
jgi:hypothetical protein